MKILCMDFDGVIHSYDSGWHGAGVIPDPPVSGAIDFLVEATKTFEVNIFSSRSHQDGGKQAMQQWLMEWVAHHYPNWTLKELIRFVFGTIKWPDAKPPAFLTIDDRAWTFNGTFPHIEALVNFKPWNKGEKRDAYPKAL